MQKSVTDIIGALERDIIQTAITTLHYQTYRKSQEMDSKMAKELINQVREQVCNHLSYISKNNLINNDKKTKIKSLKIKIIDARF